MFYHHLQYFIGLWYSGDPTPLEPKKIQIFFLVGDVHYAFGDRAKMVIFGKKN